MSIVGLTTPPALDQGHDLLQDGRAVDACVYTVCLKDEGNFVSIRSVEEEDPFRKLIHKDVAKLSYVGRISTRCLGDSECKSCFGRSLICEQIFRFEGLELVVESFELLSFLPDIGLKGRNLFQDAFVLGGKELLYVA